MQGVRDEQLWGVAEVVYRERGAVQEGSGRELCEACGVESGAGGAFGGKKEGEAGT